jgi:hypothetical protein
MFELDQKTLQASGSEKVDVVRHKLNAAGGFYRSATASIMESEDAVAVAET